MWNNQEISNTRYENQENFKADDNIFYSQYNQDRSLETCIFKGFKNGFFIDVGAHDGVNLNNTLFFEKTHKWTGINIEPIKSVYNKLVTNRPACINIECAVSDTDGYADFLCNIGYTEMLSGLKNEYDQRHLQRISYETQIMGGKNNTIIVETKRLDTICKKYNIKHINYLSIDVEGGEFSVIKSIDFKDIFIDVIGFENNYIDKQDNIVSYLEKNNYVKLPYHNADIFMIHKNSIFFKNCTDLLASK